MLSKWHVTWNMATSTRFIFSRFGRLLLVKLLGVAVLISVLYFATPTTGRMMRVGAVLGTLVVLLSILLVR
jgi:hypothetical protein